MDIDGATVAIFAARVGIPVVPKLGSLLRDGAEGDGISSMGEKWYTLPSLRDEDLQRSCQGLGVRSVSEEAVTSKPILE